MDTTRVARNLRTRIGRFSGDLSKGLCLAAQRFVSEMVYGIQASESVLLTEVGRSLEEAIPLHKTEDRLSRNLQRPELEDTLQENLLRMASGRVGADTLLIIDPSGLSKKYAKKMEYLATVRDGSAQGELTKGYWLLGVVGADVRGDRLTPLLMDLYSQNADDFESENTQILNAIDRVRSAVNGRGIWAIDRGGDRGRLLDGLLARSCRFVVRLIGDRNLRDGHGKVRNSLTMANGMRCSEQIEIVTEDQGVSKRHRVCIGRKFVKLPKREEWLMLVVIKGFGEKPMLLLTNAEDQTTRAILEIYLTRWKIEESYRFLKSSYHVEDVRVRSYTGLRNVVALLMAAFYFLAVVLGTRFELSILLRKVLAKVRRFFEVPEFKFYALADGLFRILFRTGHAPTTKPPVGKVPQLAFSFRP